MKNTLLSLSHSVVALAALRGGVVLTMAILTNLITIQEMGQLSAVYSVTVAGAQILGFALNTLALDLAKDSSGTPQEQSKIALGCLVCWLFASLMILGIARVEQSIILSNLFNNIVSPYSYAVGVVWLCGMGFEMMALGLAVGMQKMRVMAIVGVIQAILMTNVTLIAVVNFGYDGIFVTPVISFLSGIAILVLMKPWKAINEWRPILGLLNKKIKNVVGPSVIAALFLTSLNVVMIYHKSIEHNPFFDLALFSISMQIISITSFIPQVLYNTTISRYYTFTTNNYNSNKIIYTGAVTSLFVCTIVSIFVYIFRFYIVYIYGHRYIEIESLVILLGLILMTQGPLQILTQKYSISDRQWELALICALSSGAGYGYFLMHSDRSGATMLTSLLVANGVRASLVLLGLLSKSDKIDVRG